MSIVAQVKMKQNRQFLTKRHWGKKQNPNLKNENDKQSLEKSFFVKEFLMNDVIFAHSSIGVYEAIIH